MKAFHSVFLVILFFTGCVFNKSNEIEYDRIAYSRKQFNEVLEYYKADPLKFRAAEFLIENIAYHTYIDSKALPYYYDYYELFSTGKYTPQEILDSLKKMN